MQASEKYPAKYYEPENKDDNRTLSHGKRLRKSTFTVGEFENRDGENDKIEHRCREPDNSNALHKQKRKNQ